MLSEAERKNLEPSPNHKIKYALSNAPEDIPMKELVRVSGARWPIRRCFQEDKSELGLDHYEHRSWTAWDRHMRLVFLAQLFMIRLEIKSKKTPALSLPQARLLMECSFPQPKRQPAYLSEPPRLRYSAHNPPIPANNLRARARSSLASAEKSLLTAWRTLERYHDDLVLVYGFAIKSLQKDFSDPGQDGPIRAAEFHPGNAGKRDRIREDVATVGRLLPGT